MTAPRQLAERQGARLLLARQRRNQHPLRYHQLWHREAPRTSQAMAFAIACQASLLHAIILGGNRSGKTDLLAVILTCYALGSDHPDVAEFAHRNGLDVSAIPKGPGTVWAVALTFGDSRRYLRPKFDRFAPAGSKWRGRDMENEAELVFPNGGKVVFKAVKQGREGFQGDNVRAVGFDEEPHDMGVVEEAEMRIVDQSGRLFFSMTPLSGWTALLVTHVRERPPTTRVVWLHGADNPHVPPEMLEAVLRGKSAAKRAARARGEIVALEGLVFEAFERRLHVVPSFDPPSEWERYVFVDFGTRNPSAWLLAALDPSDDVLHIYREHYHANWLLRQHVEAVQRLLRDQPEPAAWVVDPADRGARLELANVHGIGTIAADKDVMRGIDDVNARLELDPAGRPHLLIHDRCKHTIAEVETYRWAEKRGELDVERVIKANDHACDALRYGCRFLASQMVGVAVV